MDNSAIFDKSDKGREEIITRKHKLAPRLRSLLVLVDGKKTAGELLLQLAGMGLDQSSLDQLFDQQFIEPSSGVLVETRPSATEAPEALNANRPSSPAKTPEDKPKSSRPAGNGMIAASQIMALQTFFNTTIKSTLGLRGFTLQLKAERASSLSDFQNLRQPYYDAVLKAKGQDMAIALRDRLDQLLLDAENSM